MVYRNAYIIKEMMNKVDALQACQSTCHECTLKDKVENYKEYIGAEKEELIMQKDMKKGRYEREKT